MDLARFAALAAEQLKAERLLPIHYGAYEIPGIYEPVADPLDRLMAATQRATPLAVGATTDV